MGHGLDPLDHDQDGNDRIDSEDDFDGDGLSNLSEQIHGTAPNSPDTDGDGTADGTETQQGSDPKDALDLGQAPPEDELVDLTLLVGDFSGSRSERWDLVVGPIAHQATQYGVVESDDYRLQKGKTHEIRIIHRGTRPEYIGRQGFPDYDYSADITRAAGENDLVIIEDPDDILRIGWYAGGDPALGGPNYAEEKSAKLHLPMVDLDITSPAVSDKDEETPGGSVRFNGDDDDGDSIPDYQDPSVAGEDDFAELTLRTIMPADLQELAGKMVVTFAPGLVRLWKDTNKTQEVISNVTEFDPSLDHTIYVERVSPSSTPITIEGKYTPDNLAYQNAGFTVLGTSTKDTVRLNSDFGGVALESVDYLDSHAVHQDDNAEEFPAAWLDVNHDGDALDEEVGEVRSPIAYTRSLSGDNSYVSVTTRIKISNNFANSTIKIRGTGPNGISIPATTATVSNFGGGNVYATVTDVTSTVPFVNTVKYYEHFAINWQISFDNGVTYTNAGSSDNQLYLTWDDPELEVLTWTVLHVSTVAADGVGGTIGANDDLVRNKIWEKIASPNDHIRRASDNAVLSYYGFQDANESGAYDPGTDGNRNSAALCQVFDYIALVEEGNGQCTAWTSFMIATLWSQGLKHVNGSEVKGVVVTSKDARMAVKDWTKNGAGPWDIPSAFQPSLVSPSVDTINFFPGPGEAGDDFGKPGQGNSPNPPAVFPGHAIVLVNGLYYDPSYSLGAYTDPKKYEIDAFEGTIKEPVIGQWILESAPPDNNNVADESDEINDYDERSGSEFIPNGD